MQQPSEDVTRILKAAGEGSSAAGEDLFRIVYAELRRLARSWMAKTPPGQTLQPTALVHEVFVRLVGREAGDWQSRAHFFFAASRAMRDILVERARSKGRIKRGGNRGRIDLDNLVVAIDSPSDDLLGLDEAMQRLEVEYPWEHRVVMLRFFGGMTNPEVAMAMGTPLRTIERDWRFARAWLLDALSEDRPNGTE